MHSLVGVALGQKWREHHTSTTSGDSAQPDLPSRQPVIEEDRFVICYRGRECKLGNTQEFQLMSLLVRRFGTFVREHSICKTIWDQPTKNRNALQRVVTNLRSALRRDRIEGLTIESEKGGHYRLVKSEEEK